MDITDQIKQTIDDITRREIKEIIIICVGDLRYRFDYDTILHYNLDYHYEVVRIDFKDGSFVEFQKCNVICIEVNK